MTGIASVLALKHIGAGRFGQASALAKPLSSAEAVGDFFPSDE
jgi:hypothetical protein